MLCLEKSVLHQLPDENRTILYRLPHEILREFLVTVLWSVSDCMCAGMEQWPEVLCLDFHAIGRF